MKARTFAIAACLLVGVASSPAEARGHCRSGLMYRPSRGTCVSLSSFVRHVSPSHGRRHLAHAEGRAGRGRHAIRERIRIVRVFVERSVPVPQPAASPPPPAQVADASVLSDIPYADAGERSLNPMPRMRTWSR